MMLAGLNPQQQLAVTLPDQHALVLAGAGSGKTRVLTTRMAWLMQNQGISPFALMAVTFTNKAAREMLTRLTAQIPLDTRGMWVGTFHGLCNRLLRAHHRDAGLVQTFQILDSADQQAAIKRMLKSAGVDDTQFTPRNVQNFINSAKEDGHRPDQIDAVDVYARGMVTLYHQYQEQCEREGVVDFSELLLRAYELLENNAPIREHYQRRFRHILVDEFQDTNTLQYRWLTLLAGGGACLFAVGDDDQSIYAFRGANVHNMADFERDYAKGQVIRLEQNYRSSGHILDAANHLIARNTDRLGKDLWTDQGEGERIRIMELPSDTLEADRIVEDIRARLESGSARQDIAILYRSNAQSRALEHALFSAGIAYRVYGGLRFFERQEVKHALAYLRLIDNPRDDTAWLRVVNFPTRGIGARSLEQLAEHAQSYQTSLYEAVAHVPGKAGSRLAGFVGLIADMANQAQHVPLPELIEYVIENSGLQAHYQAAREGQDRLENLHELISAAAAFVTEENWNQWPASQVDDNVVSIPATAGDDAATMADVRLPMSPLAAFLSHASLEAGDNQAQAGQDAIQLMTIHSAKGLEFDTVYITGLEDGLFPHENSLMEAAGLEEERRLMYVAMTRARQHLSLSLAQSRMLHGKTRYPMRSRFLDELPTDNLHWLTPRDQRIAASDTPSWSGAFRRGGQSFRAGEHTLNPVVPRSTASVVKVGDQEFRIGQGISHARFGEGTILSLSGSGAEAQAQIQFQEVGTKTLALGIAKLTIIAG